MRAHFSLELFEGKRSGCEGVYPGFCGTAWLDLKFGVDRWGRARPDLSFAHKFRFDPLWPQWQWKGQRIVDGLPILVTVCEGDDRRCEVEQFVEPLRDTPPEKRGEISGVLFSKFRLSGKAGPLSFSFRLATENTNRHPELHYAKGANEAIHYLHHLGLASLFAGSGAKYSWRGVCGCASKMDDQVLGQRPREIYWWTGRDGHRLLLKWYSLGEHGIGGYLEAGSPVAAIQYVEINPGFLRRYVDPKTKEPYSVVGLFGFGGDDLARKTGLTPPPIVPGVPGLQQVVSSPYCDRFFNIARQESNDRRKIIVSNEQDFFEDFEKEHGASLDSHAVLPPQTQVIRQSSPDFIHDFRITIHRRRHLPARPARPTAGARRYRRRTA